ncbi:Zn-ribbon domain-containing OB-fold protein [Pseudonocardia abyssalis]|uniref:OB-fold domain-containing protein n=1 Tax=Pseudonocardia abyssalis TaxID=2792008 RepID=A0ABS6UWC7_9PSEU|nr:OB-fold domain-containing protein [Pseudonocardia abyssalis]MBW0113785.1 OB-fold domain-containing protein [Pseudonocardia abyssalis]MBW0136271.1 OB-fold domain-containing protein [Pseudonocardia abyssalis]
MTHPALADPRPVVQTGPDGLHRVAGRLCPACGGVAAFAWPRCPACRGEVGPAEFGPDGTVWSATVVRIPVPGRTPPYVLAYVDLDDGPRVLAHLTGDAAPPIGARVRLTAPSADGDVRVEVLA